MRTPPLVTIITPSYNHAKYLRNAIESIKNQTYSNIEYYIVDDGSTDGTHELMEKLAIEYPNYHFEIHKENRGHVRISETVEKCNGDYICLLSSDDWYLPEMIDLQIKKFETLDSSYGLVHTNGYFYFEKSGEKELIRSEDEILPEGMVLKEMLNLEFAIMPISPMYRRETLLRYKFLEGYKAQGEAINFLIATNYKIAYISTPLTVQRRHDTNISNDIDRMIEDNIGNRNKKSFYEYLFSHPDFPSSLQYLKPKVLAYPMYIKGWELIRLYKRKREGKELLLKAAKTYPRYLLTKPRLLIGLILSL